MAWADPGVRGCVVEASLNLEVYGVSGGTSVPVEIELVGEVADSWVNTVPRDSAGWVASVETGVLG